MVKEIFFFNDASSPEIYTLSLHDALPIAFQRADDGDKLHPVVGRPRFAAEELAFAPAVLEKRAPAARTGVALARAVGVDHHRRRHAAPLTRARPRTRAPAALRMPTPSCA